jgi:predicted acylesterase/phospholipase RssA/CRP-like cAMP-binding protein
MSDDQSTAAAQGSDAPEPLGSDGPRPGDPRLRAAVLHLFGDEAVAEAVGRIATVHELSAGTTVFRQGDAGDSAYLVLTGRLRVVRRDDGAEEVLADAVHGEIVGELALLTGEDRSATVYAVRDSAVARIAAADFEALLRAQPGASLPIMRFLAGRLRRFTVERRATPAAEATIAIFALGAADAAAYGRELASSIEGHTAVEVVLPSGGPTGLAAALERQQPGGHVLVCPGEPGWTAGNAALLRHADEILLLADARESPALGPVDAAVFAPHEYRGPRVTLVLRHPSGASPSDSARWLVPRPGVALLHVRDGDPAETARVGRWLTGRSVGLVLGGGGARGWAHLGALRAIEELGITIDLVGGTSQGALVGAAIADRRATADIRATAAPLVTHLRDYTVPMVSVLRGRLIGRTLNHIVRPGIAIEDLWLPYFSIATNLSRAERVVQTSGPVVDAVRASVSLPMILPPVVRDGELLIDGGLLDNLPIGEMRRRVGNGWIIAVDVTATAASRRYDSLEPDVSGFRLLLDRAIPFRPRRRVPSIGEVAMQTIMAGSRHLRNHAGDADARTLRLQPQLGDWSLMGFEHLEEIQEIGYREMREPLATWWATHDADASAAES